MNICFNLLKIRHLLVLLFNGISTLLGYLMPNPSLKNTSGTI